MELMMLMLDYHREMRSLCMGASEIASHHKWITKCSRLPSGVYSARLTAPSPMSGCFRLWKNDAGGSVGEWNCCSSTGMMCVMESSLCTLPSWFFRGEQGEP
jgi:hypothetical protein